VQITLPRKTIPPLLIFAGRLPIADLHSLPDKPDKYGIETDPHITAFYGFKPTDRLGYQQTDLESVRALLRTVDPFTVELRDLGVFEQARYDVLHVKVEPHPSLVGLHYSLKRLVPDSDSWDYVPHVTLAYMKKGTAARYKGVRDFWGTLVHCNQADFFFPRALREQLGPGGVHTMPFKGQHLEELMRDNQHMAALIRRLEEGDARFAAQVDEQMKRIAAMPLGKTIHESLADAVQRVLTERDQLKGKTP
jgi:2'-5' RNA ligase